MRFTHCAVPHTPGTSVHSLTSGTEGGENTIYNHLQFKKWLIGLQSIKVYKLKSKVSDKFLLLPVFELTLSFSMWLTHTAVVPRQSVTIATGTAVTPHRIAALMITLPVLFTAFIHICQNMMNRVTKIWVGSGLTNQIWIPRSLDALAQGCGVKHPSHFPLISTVKMCATVTLQAFSQPSYSAPLFHRAFLFIYLFFIYLSFHTGRWMSHGGSVCTADNLFTVCV